MTKAISKRLSKTLVDKIGVGETIQDSEVSGFGVRRQKAAPSYFLKTYIKGRRRFFTIGKHGAPWTVDSARKEARRLMTVIQTGEDPGTTKRAEREEDTFADVALRFLDEHAATLRESTRTQYARIIIKHVLPKIGKRKLFDLGRNDIVKLHLSLKETPRLANLVADVISAMLGWCEQQRLRSFGSNFCQTL